MLRSPLDRFSGGVEGQEDRKRLRDDEKAPIRDPVAPNDRA